MQLNHWAPSTAHFRTMAVASSQLPTPKHTVLTGQHHPRAFQDRSNSSNGQTQLTWISRCSYHPLPCHCLTHIMFLPEVMGSNTGSVPFRQKGQTWESFTFILFNRHMDLQSRWEAPDLPFTLYSFLSLSDNQGHELQALSLICKFILSSREFHLYCT